MDPCGWHQPCRMHAGRACGKCFMHERLSLATVAIIDWPKFLDLCLYTDRTSGACKMPTQKARRVCCMHGRLSLATVNNVSETNVRPCLGRGRMQGTCRMPAWHYEIWKYCQSTSRLQAKVLQNLRVPGGLTGNASCMTDCLWPPDHHGQSYIRVWAQAACMDLGA